MGVVTAPAAGSALVLCGALPARGGCYNISVAGSGVCREARDGTCVGYAEETARSGQSAEICTTGTETGKCADTHCDVQIGDSVYCSQCGKQGEVPIDGTCTAVDDTSKTKCKKDASNELEDTAQVCGACGAGYFLHKDGCYKIGGTVGLLICDDKTATSGKDGICVSCHEGYFKNPTQAADKQSCIACSDTATVDNVKGVAGCATCEAPSSSGAATCLTCLDGYYNSGTDSVTCAECNAACATWSGDGANKCTSCKEADKYLKTDSSAGTSQCVNEADCKTAGTHFPTTDKTSQIKVCTLCNDATNGGIADCKTCTPKTAASLAETPSVTCSACTTEGKKPNADGTACFLCPDEGVTAGCSSCSADNTCEACVPGKILKTDGNAKTCVAEAECTAGFFVSTASDVKTCISCGATSNGVTDCATCEARADDKAKAECLSCTGTKKPNADGTQCNECNIPRCTNCDTASQCAVCGDGYKHDANTCQKCTPENCKACASDINACTECVEGYTLEGGNCASSSANKSGLSTGAIVGISVAAVVACSVPLTRYLPLHNEQSEQPHCC